MSRVAVLGLGRMGAPMAARLAASGHQLSVWNRGESGHRRLEGELALASGHGQHPPGSAPTPAQAVAGAEVVVTMLADATALDEVLFGPQGAAGALGAGTVVCDMGTIGVEAAVSVAERLAGSGGGFVDAPVSGSVPAARAGSLLVMAGGSAEAVRLARPVLESLAGEVRWVGDVGSGQAMKLSVNSVLHAFNAALSEGLVLAENGGVARATALDVLSVSAVAAPFLLYKRASFEDPEGQPVAFTVDLMRKDLALIRAFARSRGASMPLTDAVSTVSDAASAAGLGDRDMSTLAEHLRSVSS